MKNKCSGWCTLNSIIGYIAGVGYCFTLILIPLAIYCFIGARKYIERAELTDSQLASHKKSLTNWSIFFSIVAFPFGLFSIIPAVICANNNVTITNIEETKEEAPKTEVEKDLTEEKKDELSDVETIAKLKSLLDEGLITEDEFKRAKNEIVNK